MTTTIVLADDHPIFRDGLRRTLEDSGEFKVLAAGESTDEAVQLTRDHKPDLVILGLSMPGGGIAATRQVAAVENPPRIAILTVSEDSNDGVVATRRHTVDGHAVGQ